ncbi:MAG: GNAT family N-acetyltransferase [Candidatus Falkowbacteria bacterium]
MRIKELKPGDISTFSKIAKEIINGCSHYDKNTKKEELSVYSEKFLHENRKAAKNVYFLVFEGKEVIGFCHGYFDSGTFWLNWLGILPAFRRQGKAAEVLKFLESYLLDRGVHKIWFDTIVTNKESIKFFQKHGYHKFTTLRNHWCGFDYFLWEKFLK